MGRNEATTRDHGEGWVTFIGVLFALLGTFNAIDGVVALAGDDKFREQNLFFGDLTFWGNANGQGLGVILCCLNLVFQLFFVAVFPIWSLTIMAADVLIIYGLCIYDRHFH